MNDENIDVPENWELVNKLTGEVKPVALFVKKGYESWSKCYVETLMQYIECSNSSSAAKFLSYLLSKSDKRTNYVIATYAAMEKESGVSQNLINTIINKLYKKKLITKIQSGVYMLSPQMIYKGSGQRGVALVKIWNDSENKGK